jgi:hypothetical protein
MRFGRDDPSSRLSSVGHYQEVTSLPRYQSRCWSEYVDEIVASRFVCSSTALAFLNNMSEKRKSGLPCAIQAKNRRQAVGNEEMLPVIMLRDKRKGIVDICPNVKLAHCIVHKIRDNAQRIKESAKSGTKQFVWQDYHSSLRNEPY